MSKKYLVTVLATLTTLGGLITLTLLLTQISVVKAAGFGKYQNGSTLYSVRLGKVHSIQGEISGIDANAKQLACSKLKVQVTADTGTPFKVIAEGFATGETLGSTCKYNLVTSGLYNQIQVSASDLNYSVNDGGYSGGTQFQPYGTKTTTTINFQVGFIRGLN